MHPLGFLAKYVSQGLVAPKESISCHSNPTMRSKSYLKKETELALNSEEISDYIESDWKSLRYHLRCLLCDPQNFYIETRRLF